MSWGADFDGEFSGTRNTMTKRERMHEKEYRASFAESNVDSYIATQIRVLREQRELNQQQLADLAGMKQSRISALEDVNYCRWSISTLKRLARAFDLRLHVSFEPFGSLLGDEAKLTAANLRRPSFEDDPAFSGWVVQTTFGTINDGDETNGAPRRESQP